jgi:hypothetical protein
MAPSLIAVVILALIVGVCVSWPLKTLFDGVRPGYGGQPTHQYALGLAMTVNVLLLLAVAAHIYLYSLPSAR